jgi:hypothetical protein
MAQEVLEGLVSDIERGSETAGGGSTHAVHGRIHISTRQLLILRIGGRPAELKSNSMFIVKEGDRIIAAGPVKNGVMRIGAANNLTAGNQYRPQINLAWLAAALLFLMGLPLSLLLIGLPLLALGVFYTNVARSWTKSVALVEAAARKHSAAA